jgi:Ca2+-binding RTX toxin-like protein
LTVDDSTGTGPLVLDASAMTANLLLDLTSANFNASDTIKGGSGSDTIALVDTTGVLVTDADFSHVTGIETLKIGGAATDSVTLGLYASADVGGSGQTLTLDDTAGTGNLMLNASAMNANLQVLLDGVGNDILSGGTGNDIFQFDSVPTQGGDQITNFNNTTQSDQIAVSAAGFGGGLASGENVSSVFETSNTSTFASTSDRFHFDTANSGLYYSPDGTTAHEVLLATITNGSAVHATDIHVVA